jgi:hypothetical protein
MDHLQDRPMGRNPNTLVHILGALHPRSGVLIRQLLRKLQSSPDFKSQGARRLLLPLRQTVGLNLQYLNLNVFGSAPNQSCYQPSAGGLLDLVLRPNLSILAPGNLGTP